ncbi:TetR/AcrR family transcriptional regulator [Nocardia sp. NPDC058058]|uniref:TetR/AcrR family transcriptional regulator n=1 Tax=Nocardia sp. NPDC058058 TaxID=3346317 RepID=UPI0036DF8DF1
MSQTKRAETSMMERRRTQAMREIQEVALGLFEEGEYRSVSVEQVAAAAGVSPSTVYRYFGTKERLVIWDDIDPQILTLLAADAQVITPAELLEQATAGARLLVMAIMGTGDEKRIQLRTRLMATEADVRLGQLRQVREVEEQVRAVFAARLGLAPEDLIPRVIAAQGVWSFVAAIDHWVENGYTEPLGEVLDRAIDLVHRSLAAILGVPA